ncbi:vacuolar fusion protein mon1 [Anaeramoeba flamelloides]|uniref:Vacuolar fusion protein mon1 n=1 Tax=Anaeramoeba flamelloides TaxID=1746091 RepID=A0ABQ8YIS0_9EUKA|nr:vacuolar fusion protein mon1 [Anaeramoeba flamelloides]
MTVNQSQVNNSEHTKFISTSDSQLKPNTASGHLKYMQNENKADFNNSVNKTETQELNEEEKNTQIEKDQKEKEEKMKNNQKENFKDRENEEKENKKQTEKNEEENGSENKNKEKEKQKQKQKEDEKEEEEEKVFSNNIISKEEDLKKKAQDFREQISKESIGRRYQKHVNEGPLDEKWKSHKKHFFILSQAGKLIYSRYGSDIKLTSLLCVPQALVSFVSDLGDKIKSIRACDHLFVFKIQGPIILVCVSQTGESAKQLRRQLKFLYKQIIFFLSTKGIEFLKDRPSLDLRVLLGGTTKFFDSLIYRMSSPEFVLDSIKFLKMNSQTREKVASAFKLTKTKFLKFALLTSDCGMIQLTQTKRNPISINDLFLIQNFVADHSFKPNEIWTPLCLPDYKSNQLLHAYLNYIDEEKKICLLFISLDPTGFMELKKKSGKFCKILKKMGALTEIQEAVKESQTFNCKKLKIKKLRHFIYKRRNTNQIISIKPTLPYSLDKYKKNLNILYKISKSRLLLNPNNQRYCSSTDTEKIFSYLTEDFEIHSVFHPLITKNQAINAENAILNWVKKNEECFFNNTIQFW